MVRVVIAVRTRKYNDAEFQDSISMYDKLQFVDPLRNEVSTTRSRRPHALASSDKLKFVVLSLFNLHAKVFDDRIRKYVVSHPPGLFKRLLRSLLTLNSDFEIFPLTDVADPTVAQ